MHKPSMSSESPFLVAGGDPAAVVDAIARTARKVRTPCGDGSMVWRVWGKGEPLVLFHGGSGSWTHWIRNISELSKHYELWLADIPGLGDSAMPPKPWVPASIADVVLAGLDQLFPRPHEAQIGRLLVRRSGRGPVGRRAGRPGVRPDADRSGGSRAARRPARAVRQAAPRHEPAEIAAVFRQNLAVLMFADPANIDALAVHLQGENIKRARFRSRPFAATDNLPARWRR
jgi:pimeloyl-ACP methyl ester carboxylesterase